MSLSKATFHLTISSFIFLAAGYVINVWLGRYLGPVDYGRYGIIISIVSLVNIVQTSGLPHAVSKYISENEKDEKEILKSGFFLQNASALVISVLFFLIARPIAQLLNDTELTPYLQLSVLIFPPFGLYTLYIGYLNGLHRFGKQAIVSSIYALTKAISIILFALVFRLYGAVIGFIIAPIFALLVGFKVPISTRRFSYKKLVMFSLPLIGIAFFGMLLQSLDLYFIRILLPDDSAPGFYTASQNIARIPFFALSALSVIIYPSVSRGLGRHELEKTKSVIHEALRSALLLLVPLIAIISATSGNLVTLLYSDSFAPASLPLSILVVGVGLITFYAIEANILMGAGTPLIPLYVSGISLGVTAFLCYLLIPKWDLSGAAAATTIGALVAVVLSSIFVYKRFQTLPSVQTIWKILLSSLIVFWVARQISISGLLLPFFYVFLAGVYLGILILLKEITYKDVSRLRRMLKS